jgi:hypothetical protein
MISRFQPRRLLISRIRKRWGRVVRTLAVRNLVEASSQDLDDVPGERSPQLSFLEPRGRLGQRIVPSPQISQDLAHGEAEEVRGGQGRAER